MVAPIDLRLQNLNETRLEITSAMLNQVEWNMTNEPVEPDLMQKHTLYAMAWGLIRLPGYPAGENFTQIASERIRLKHACRAYAAARGWSLSLDLSEISTGPEHEVWKLSPRLTSPARRSYWGTLQECCLKIVEDDIWPEGKPKDEG